MEDLYVCNVASNYISKINLQNNQQEKIYITNDEKILGSHGMDLNNKKLYVAASDNFNFYEIHLKDRKVNEFYVGMLTNDLKIKNNFAYLICSESNCLLVYDIIEKSMMYEIKCGNYPHSMDIYDESKILSVTNMHNNELTIIDYEKNDFIRNIKTGNLPMQSKFYKDGKYIFVCESNLGDDVEGTFSIYDVNTGEKINSIILSKSPIDMCFDYEDNIAFVSNHLGSSVSIVDLNEFKEISRIEIPGMPRGVYKNGRFLYIAISDKDILLKYDMYSTEKSYINLGCEPTGVYVF